MLIHYCWFGKKNKPPIVLKCIDSWRRLHPYAKIIEWNEDNFNVECCAYVKKAYDEGGNGPLYQTTVDTTCCTILEEFI